MREAKGMTNLPVRAAEVDAVEMLPGVWRRTLNYGERLMVVQVTLEEGVLPHHRSLNTEDEDQENDEGIEEERRLMYVAMTRASDHLHLTWSMSRRGEAARPSRFLREIPDSLLYEA